MGATGATVNVPVYTAYGNTALSGPTATNFQGRLGTDQQRQLQLQRLCCRSLESVAQDHQFDANYTWSHALDYAQNANTQGAAETWYDPYGNPQINYGDSSFNVPNRFVAYALYNLPNLNVSNPLKWVANDWSINDSFQMQNGLPFTAGVSGKPSGAIAGNWNGAGGPAIIPQIGYDTYKYPRRIVDDVRVQKSFDFEGSHTIRSVDLVLNAFNIANHQNITSYQATYLYSLSGTTATYTGQGGSGPKTFLVPNNSNNSGFLYTPRQVEIAARINF